MRPEVPKDLSENVNYCPHELDNIVHFKPQAAAPEIRGIL